MSVSRLPKGDLIFTSCDNLYFLEHAKALHASCIQQNLLLYIHIINPSPEAFDLAGEYKIKYTYEHSNIHKKSYYNANRFLILEKLFNNNRVLIVDVDCFFISQFRFPDADFGIFLRPEASDKMKVAAGGLYITPTSFQVLKDINKNILDLKFDNWFNDQLAILQAYEKHKNSLKVIDIFDSTFMDWEFNSNSIVWTGKGSRKHINTKYLNKKLELESWLDENCNF